MGTGMKQFSIFINDKPIRLKYNGEGNFEVDWAGANYEILNQMPSDFWDAIAAQAAEGVTHFWLDENSENAPVFWTEETSKSAIDRTEPPSAAEFLLEVFLTSKRGQALIGDMRERFARDCEELGHKR